MSSWGRTYFLRHGPWCLLLWQLTAYTCSFPSRKARPFLSQGCFSSLGLYWWRPQSGRLLSHKEPPTKDNNFSLYSPFPSPWSQFYIQLLYKPHLRTWSLLCRLFRQDRAVLEHFFNFAKVSYFWRGFSYFFGQKKIFNFLYFWH